MTRTPTLKEIREEARRVFGPTATVHCARWSVYVDVDGFEIRITRPDATDAAAARRFAYETLKALPGKETV